MMEINTPLLRATANRYSFGPLSTHCIVVHCSALSTALKLNELYTFNCVAAPLMALWVRERSGVNPAGRRYRSILGPRAAIGPEIGPCL